MSDEPFNYRSMLSRYMADIFDAEGIDYLRPSSFTEKEFQEMKRIADEADGKLKAPDS